MPNKKDNENEQSSGSDTIGSNGSDSGSASGSGGSGSDTGTNGSGRDANGSSIGIDGSGRIDGSADSGNIGSDNASEPIESSNASSNGISGNQNANDNRRVRRNARPIRIGEFGSSRNRNTVTDDSDGSNGIDGTEGDSGDNREPVIRLGAKSSGRPKATTKSESAETVFEIGKTKDLIKVFITSIFEIPAVSLKQDFWRLTKEEANLLTDSVIDYLKSMPKSKASKLAQFISENLPLLNLLMVSFFIVSERVRSSIAIAQITKAGNDFKTKSETAQPVNNGFVGTPLDAVFGVN